MKFKLFILIALTLSLFSNCEKDDATEESLFRKIEQDETAILNCVEKINAYKTNCEKILIGSPESKYAPNACYKLGKLNNIFGHYSDANAYYQKLVTFYPDSPLCADGLFNMARIYQSHMDDADQSIAAYTRLIQLYSDSEFALPSMVDLGKIHSAAENWESSLQIYQKVIDTYPAHKICDDILFRIADIYQTKLNNHEQAKLLYNRLLNDFPNSNWFVLSRERLEQLNEGGNRHDN